MSDAFEAAAADAGIGLFAGRADPNVANGFFGMLDISDSNRDHQCQAFNERFVNTNTLVDSNGIVSQRVR